MKRMILTATALTALGLTALPAVVSAHESDDKDHITKTYNLKDFSEVKIAGVYELDITVGPDYSLVIEGHQKEMDLAEVEVRGDQLYMGRSERLWKKNSNVNGDNSLKATLTLPDLTAINVSGVAELDATGIDSDRFEITVSGVAEVELSGKCSFLEAKVNGVGEVDAEDLECSRVEAGVNGVGELTVYASERVEANVNGMGAIEVYGSPKQVEKKKGWFSEITIH